MDREVWVGWEVWEVWEVSKKFFFSEFERGGRKKYGYLIRKNKRMRCLFYIGCLIYRFFFGAFLKPRLSLFFYSDLYVLCFFTYHILVVY